MPRASSKIDGRPPPPPQSHGRYLGGDAALDEKVAPAADLLRLTASRRQSQARGQTSGGCNQTALLSQLCAALCAFEYVHLQMGGRISVCVCVCVCVCVDGWRDRAREGGTESDTVSDTERPRETHRWRERWRASERSSSANAPEARGRSVHLSS
jgi:hypothetical protein